MINEFLDRIGMNAAHAFSGKEDNPTIEPLVSGYMYFIPLFPSEIYKYLSNISNDVIFAIQCVSVEIPEININLVEKKGFGGARQFIPSSANHGDTFSIRFYETKHADIINIIKIWHGAIFDHNSGFMRLPPKKSSYAGQGVLIISNQEMRPWNIRYGLVFNGIFPVNLPHNNLNPDITNNSVVDITVQFAFDTVHDIREILMLEGIGAVKDIVKKVF